jgi:hypothetical protein
MPLQIPLGKIKELDLRDPAVFDAFQKKVQDMITFDRGEDAFWFGQIIENLLREKPELTTDPALVDKYENLIVLTKWEALNFLSEKEIIGLFTEHFKEALETSDYDAWTKLDAKLVGMLIYEDRDALKRNIADALMKNQQQITDKEIIFAENKVSPTVANWMKDYVRFMGTGQLDKLKQAEYFSDNKNMAALDVPIKEKMMKLFNFYERIRLSSLTLEGVEETIPVPEGEWEEKEGVIRNGRFEPDDPKFVKEYYDSLYAIFPERKAEELLIKEKAVLELTPEEEKTAAAEEETLTKKTSGTATKIYDELYQNLVPPQPGKAPDAIMVRAALRILAKTGGIVDLFEKEKRFNEFLISYLKEKGRTREMGDFKVYPKAPQYLGIFLQHVLRDILKMNEAVSARFGMQLINLLKKAGGDAKYGRLVYFDEVKETFGWVK